jgi:activator of 2-hydroxyglutaryl-CoA dehydratase
VSALAEALGRPVRVVADPQVVGALGAALSVR